MHVLTHFNNSGQAHMVDISEKNHTKRIAIASGKISMQASTFQLIQQGNAKKGDVLGIARIAAIQGCKKTAEIIPLCHPLLLTHINIEFALDEVNHQVICTAQTETTGPTGVEIEALTAVSVALLTIYDMCKSTDRGMSISEIHLQQKRGGKSGDWYK